MEKALLISGIKSFFKKLFRRKKIKSLQNDPYVKEEFEFVEKHNGRIRKILNEEDYKVL